MYGNIPEFHAQNTQHVCCFLKVSHDLKHCVSSHLRQESFVDVSKKSFQVCAVQSMLAFKFCVLAHGRQQSCLGFRFSSFLIHPGSCSPCFRSPFANEASAGSSRTYLCSEGFSEGSSHPHIQGFVPFLHAETLLHEIWRGDAHVSAVSGGIA